MLDLIKLDGSDVWSPVPETAMDGQTDTWRLVSDAESDDDDSDDFDAFFQKAAEVDMSWIDEVADDDLLPPKKKAKKDPVLR